MSNIIGQKFKHLKFFVSFLEAVFFFIEFVIYEHTCNALISDCPNNDQKCDSKGNLLSWNYPIVL